MISINTNEPVFNMARYNAASLPLKGLLLVLLICSASGHGFAQSSIKLEGQIVCCADYWAEADRSKVEFGTAADLLKAKSCVENGDPTILAVREGDKFSLYQLELGRFRLPGKDFLNEKFSIVATYNGVNVHPLLNFTHKRHTLSLVMVKGRDPGMSYSVTF